MEVEQIMHVVVAARTMALVVERFTLLRRTLLAMLAGAMALPCRLNQFRFLHPLHLPIIVIIYIEILVLDMFIVVVSPATASIVGLSAFICTILPRGPTGTLALPCRLNQLCKWRG